MSTGLRTILSLATVFQLASAAWAEETFRVAQGAYTQCVAVHNGERWNIVGPHLDAQACFARARQCTGNPNVQVTHYGTLVIIQTPYRQCAR
ncbi:exported protein of unknown function [Bradyrhizobium vignae]|uniref:Uncharacterized protein n=1 Tax=Bradyrhizobium vignae TaxID=1549949 RepID=A0A2U3PU99_9BRAD|nr:exported protein of unknown function [Bradyrhizobium vignae]